MKYPDSGLLFISSQWLVDWWNKSMDIVKLDLNGEDYDRAQEKIRPILMKAVEYAKRGLGHNEQELEAHRADGGNYVRHKTKPVKRWKLRS